MPSPTFTRHSLACAVQAAITITALSLTMGAQAAPGPVDGSNNTVVIDGSGTASIPTIDHPYAHLPDAPPNFKAIAGGHGQYGGNANNNSLTMSGAPAGAALPASTIMGGVSDGGNANGNTVKLEAGSYYPVNDIYGGRVVEGTGTASNNSVEITDVKRNGSADGHVLWVVGGAVDSDTGGDAAGNTVTMHSGEVGSISGGAANGLGDARDNRVVVHGGTITGFGSSYGAAAVAGGEAMEGSGNNNSVLIDGNATITGHVSGGLSMNGNANGNTVTLKGGTYGGGTEEVEIHGGRVLGGTGSANGNTVEISGIQSMNTWVVGGIVDSSQGGSANDNKVVLHNGTAWAITGGHANTNGNARNNQVEINGGTIMAVAGGEAFQGEATGNTVIIRGSTITQYVAGGALEAKDYAPGVAPSGKATNNTVTIEGNGADLSSAALYGGYGPASATGDLFTGNTLNLNGVNGMQVREVANFAFLSFALPETTQNGDTILSVTGTADIRGSTIGVRMQGDDPLLAVGDTVKLIDAGELKADSTIQTRGLQGSTIEYAFDTQQSGNTLTSTVTRRGSTESAKSLSEGFVAGAAALTAAADFSSSQGTAAAVGAVAGAGSNAPGQSFGTTGGGSVRNNTGSHVDVRSFNLVAGLAKGFKQADGELTVGGFFEYGHGNYSSYNNFATGAVRGDGKTRSFGLGVLGHYALDSGVYVEGSVRAGRAEQDYRSGDLLPNVTVSYDSKTNYVGSHIGAGKVWTLNESLDLDTYAHYVWQRQGGDTVRLSSGETLAFSAVTSQRIRLGARLTKGLTDTVSAYVGAGYENELDGKAKATTNGVPITSPSMKGDSGLLELGLSTRPLKNKALTLGVGVQGYFGQKEGVTGSLQVGYKF